MESFAILKFWKPSTARFAGCGDAISSAAADDDDAGSLVSAVDGGEEEEESFFELEFTLPDYDHKQGPIDQKIGRIGDFISAEKADARIGAKPQSPMKILRESAPKLRVFMFGKLIGKSKPEKQRDSTEPKRKTKINFMVKLRIEDESTSKKKFSRSDSSRITGDREIDGSSRRFSKDSVHKYLNLIKKPLYVKLSSTASKRSSDRRGPFDSARAASFSSPRKSEERATRFHVSCKNLAKSRSAGALLFGVSSPAGLKDDSLTQQNDGIQGAILHCKQSFNSSPKERCKMSGCVSDSSHDKSNQTT